MKVYQLIAIKEGFIDSHRYFYENTLGIYDSLEAAKEELNRLNEEKRAEQKKQYRRHDYTYLDDYSLIEWECNDQSSAKEIE